MVSPVSLTNNIHTYCTLSLKYNIPLRLDTQKILCKKNWNKCPILYSQINGKLNHAKVGRPQVIWLSDSLWHQWKTKCLLNYSWKYGVFCYGFHSEKVIW